MALVRLFGSTRAVPSTLALEAATAVSPAPKVLCGQGSIRLAQECTRSFYVSLVTLSHELAPVYPVMQKHVTE